MYVYTQCDAAGIVKYLSDKGERCVSRDCVSRANVCNFWAAGESKVYILISGEIRLSVRNCGLRRYIWLELIVEKYIVKIDCKEMFEQSFPRFIF